MQEPIIDPSPVTPPATLPNMDILDREENRDRSEDDLRRTDIRIFGLLVGAVLVLAALLWAVFIR